jgi:hypothetical protein
MGTYRQPKIINDKYGLKAAGDAIADFNAGISNLAGSDSEESSESKKDTSYVTKKEFEDYKIKQDLASQIKAWNAKGGSNGQLKMLSNTPQKNLQLSEFWKTDAKDAFYNAVLENDKMKQQKILKDVDKTVGALKFFQDNNDKLTKASLMPDGSAGSLNINLLDINTTKYLKDINTNNGNGLTLSYDEEDNLKIGAEDADDLYIDNVVDLGLNPNENSQELVYTMGDPNKVVDEMEGDGLVTKIVKQLFPNRIKESDDGKIEEIEEYTIDEGNQIASTLATSISHENINNDQNYSQSVYPMAVQMAATRAKDLQITKDGLNDLDNELLSIQEAMGINFSEAYQTEGQAPFGNYVGGNINYNTENSPIAMNQRRLMSWFYNSSWYNRKIQPYVKQQTVEDLTKQTDKETESNIKQANEGFDTDMQYVQE